MKPRVTLDELQRWKKPGVAWDLAKEALKAGDIARAECFLPYMLPSDRRLMSRRIAAARSDG